MLTYMEVMMALTIVVHLYASDEGIGALRSFEAKVMPVLKAHGGQLMAAFTPSLGFSNIEPAPDEIHIVKFPTAQQFQTYRDDPEHLRLAEERARVIRKTEVIVSGEMVLYD